MSFLKLDIQRGLIVYFVTHQIGHMRGVTSASHEFALDQIVFSTVGLLSSPRYLSTWRHIEMINPVGRKTPNRIRTVLFPQSYFINLIIFCCIIFYLHHHHYVCWFDFESIIRRLKKIEDWKIWIHKCQHFQSISFQSASFSPKHWDD